MSGIVVCQLRLWSKDRISDPINKSGIVQRAKVHKNVSGICGVRTAVGDFVRMADRVGHCHHLVYMYMCTSWIECRFTSVFERQGQGHPKVSHLLGHGYTKGQSHEVIRSLN